MDYAFQVVAGTAAPEGSTVKKVGDEWVLTHPSGREIARSHDKKLLEDYRLQRDSARKTAASDETPLPCGCWVVNDFDRGTATQEVSCGLHSEAEAIALANGPTDAAYNAWYDGGGYDRAYRERFGSRTAARSKREVEDAPVQTGMRPAGIRQAPSTDQKKVRRQMTRKAAQDYSRPEEFVCAFCKGDYADAFGTDSQSDLEDHYEQAHGSRTNPKESRMSTSREAQILQAMAVASHDDQRRLAIELADLRATRTASIQADRESDLGQRIVDAHLTPIRTHALNTTATDWLDEVHVASADPTLAMKTEANLWFGRTSAEVRADHEEFVIQAQGMARRVASRHGEMMPVAERAFLDQVAHLHRVTAGENNGNAESTVTDYDTKTDQDPYLADDWDEDGDMGVHPPMPGAGQSTGSKVAERGAKRPEGMDSRTYFDTVACEKCAGKGWVDLGVDFDWTPADNTCPKCKGTGLRSGATASKTAGPTRGDFSLSDAKNEEGEWIMSPEEIRAEMSAQEEPYEDGDLDDYYAVRRTASEGGQTCATCGDAIAKDPSGEDPSTYHHDNGEKHDHEAKPGGGDSKESSRKVAVEGQRPLHEIADDIRANWPNVFYGAVPYLEAMGYLDSMDDNFGADDARTVVSYFLSNTKTWRGPEAARLKKELKALTDSQGRRAYSSLEATAAEEKDCTRCKGTGRGEGGTSGQSFCPKCKGSGVQKTAEVLVDENSGSQGVSGLEDVTVQNQQHPEGAFPWEIGETQGFVSGASKTAAEYQGGSPKEGDTAKCHKDGGAIQFFDGQWMHLKGTGDGHNDVYPPNKDERNEKNSAKVDPTLGQTAIQRAAAFRATVQANLNR